MNLDKTSTTLKKINRLFEIINEIGEASSTEQDLLKAYVEDLYSAVSDGEKLSPTAKSQTSTKAAVAPIAAAAVTSVAAGPSNPEPAPVAPAPVAPAPPPQKAATPKPAPAKSVNPDMAELFELDAISELSDKLSSQPITDLTRAMGINERILTVNELFGGDNEAFNSTMKALNGLSSYDEAKNVLMDSAAVKYDWSKPSNHKKVKIFIKLVRRRYN